jgi:beta-glucanase (GH16 family)
MPYFTSVLDDRNQPLPLSNNPTHWFTAAADGTVTGTNGPDAIYATSGHATLIGNGGDDTFYVNSHDTVAGGAGVDTVVTYWGGFALPEDVENLVVTGDGAVARGNRLDNLIAGGAGRQTFFGGGGHDVFEGGADSDIFVASRADHGNVVVNDFQSGVDRIRLDGFTAFTDFTSVQNSMTQAGGDVVVNLGDGQTLTLRGHQTTDFSAADFWTAIDLSHFQLAFADEFNSFDWSPDGSHGWRTTLDWEARTLPANHEAQYYSDSSVGVNPFHLHDGVLDIAATAGSNPLGLPYNSGVITTQGSFSQLYGYFEMRAELPAGAGLWPTFWLLPANHSWPPELDVFEVLGSDPTTAVATVHSASTGAHTRVASAVATADLSEGFHTFGVNWKPDIIQWYIDGVEVAEAPTPADMHQPMYLLANLAVGGAGSWPGVADPSAFPATMTIDYIHVYRSSPDINTPQHHVPVVTAPDVAATHGQGLAASALFSVSDADGDTITKYQFWDSTTDPASGHWVVNGVAQGTNQAIEVTAAQLAQTTFQSGSGSDDLWVRAFDGFDWSGWKEFHVNAPVDQKPVVSGSDASLTLNSSVAVTSLFSVSDPENDPIVQFEFWDSNPAATSGHFAINGTPQGANQAIDVPAAQLNQTSFVAGSAPDVDQIWERAFDGSLWSDWHMLNFISHA